MPYNATITRLPAYALFDLKGPKEVLRQWAPDLPTFPAKPNTLTRDKHQILCHIGPDKWLLRTDMDHEQTLQTALRPEESPPEISIVRISDTLTFFRITGKDAPQVMPIGCPLDLHESTFAPDAVSYTEFFGLKALILRCDGGFEVAVEQSFGDMMADYLDRALA